MQITVNGESRDIVGIMTLAGLLESLGINPKSVVVERNLQIVDRSRLEMENLNEGDCIEIIRFVGGG
ncbi:MAG: sulfur carrier protein ThiS [Deltaproteobacteria bacterium]|nr:sulfur carrier protein ThiS [Deltaproteobacteria bacterium]